MINTTFFKKTFKLIINLLKYFFTFFICVILTLSVQDSLGYNEDIGFSFSLILSTICFLILLRLEGKSPKKFLNIHKVKLKSILLLILLSISIVFLINLGLGNLLIKSLNYRVNDSQGLYFRNMIHLFFLAPLCEEIFFRGIIFRKLKESLPLWLAIIIQAFLFGYFHGAIVNVLLSAITGVFFALVYNYTNNLTTAILLHSFINILIAILSSLPFPVDINPIISIVIGVSSLLLFIKLFFRSKKALI